MTSPEELLARLAERGWTLGTCESLTGGGIAASLTAVPGASAVVRGALVTYASDLKASLVGVDADEIAAHGVITEATATQMAVGARRVLGVDLAAACTGVAGPDPQDGQQPGVVWIAVAGPGDHDLATRRLRLSGDRAGIREKTGSAVMNFLGDLV